MWFIGVEVEQEMSAPPPKKILDLPLQNHACQVEAKIVMEKSCSTNHLHFYNDKSFLPNFFQ